MKQEHIQLYKLENSSDEIKTTLYFAWAVAVFRTSVIKQLISTLIIDGEFNEKHQEVVMSVVKRSTVVVGYAIDVNEVYNILMALIFQVTTVYQTKKVETIDELVAKPTFLRNIEKIAGYHMDTFNNVMDYIWKIK